MKLRTDFRVLAISLLLFAVAQEGKSQNVTVSNTLEHEAIIGWEKKIQGSYKSQSNSLKKTNVALGDIGRQQREVKKWQQQYNSYLKTTQGFASQLAASCTLYHQGVETLAALWEIYNAQKIHAEGTFATIGMSTIYLEIATEYLRTFKQLKNCVKKGTNANMLTGAERAKLIWDLSADLQRLNSKLRRLSSCILAFSFEDVWNKAIAGKLEKSPGQLAKEASKRAQKAAANVSKMYKSKAFSQ